MDDRDEVSELLARIGLRDAQAFEALYRRASSRLMAVALRVTQDRAAAEDVLQEVFAAIWNRAADAAPGQHRTLAWLCVVTRNRAIPAAQAPARGAAALARRRRRRAHARRAGRGRLAHRAAAGP